MPATRSSGRERGTQRLQHGGPSPQPCTADWGGALPAGTCAKGSNGRPGRAVGSVIRVDAGGTRLRIRALQAMGHCSARIARAAGTSEQATQRLTRGTARTVSPDLRDAFARTYEAWWDKRPPETTRQQKAAAAAARRRAARANWCPGAGLDDDLLDQAGYRPESSWKPARGTGVAADSGGPVTSLKGSDMSCDRRHTAALVADVLAVLHQHGYRPGDLVHAHRAIRLIGDLARIYQGTQDAPAGAYIIQVPPGPQASQASYQSGRRDWNRGPLTPVTICGVGRRRLPWPN